MFLLVLFCASAIAAEIPSKNKATPQLIKQQTHAARRFKSLYSDGQKKNVIERNKTKVEAVNPNIARNMQSSQPLSGRNRLKGLHKGSQKLRYEDVCDTVCNDLPKRDNEPVCMMYSRYKKAYQFFMNECHARRSICKENLLLHQVHMSRCVNSNQYYMPVN